MRIAGHFLAALALVLACGGHWALLQGIAWAGMVVDYSQEQGVSRGVAMTFNGEHPCELCQAIDEAQKQEEREPQSQSFQEMRHFKILPRRLERVVAPFCARTNQPRAADWLLPFVAGKSPEIPPPRNLG